MRRGFLYLLILACISSVLATSETINLDTVVVVCAIGSDCQGIQSEMNNLVNVKTTDAEIRKTIRRLIIKHSVKALIYGRYQRGTQQILVVEVSKREKIKRIYFESKKDIDFSSVLKFLPYKVGQKHDSRRDLEAKSVVQEYLSDNGYKTHAIEIIRRKVAFGIELKFVVKVGEVSKVRNIKITTDNPNEVARLKKIFRKFRNKTWSTVKFKVVVDQVSKEMFNIGYFFSNIDIDYETSEKDKNSVDLKIRINFGDKVAFSFNNNKLFSHGELLETIKGYYLENGTNIADNGIVKAVDDKYRSVGVYNTKIKIRRSSGTTKFGINFTNYFLDIKEGKKIEVENVTFSGARSFSENELLDLYYQKASPLAARRYLDRSYLDNFTKIIKRRYLSDGFMFVETFEPKVIFNEKLDRVKIEFRVKEGVQSEIVRINLTGLNEATRKRIIGIISNKVGQPLNLIAIDKDIKIIMEELKEDGYFFVKLLSSKDSVLKHSKDYTKSELNLDIVLGKKAFYDDHHISGYIDTKIKVIEREIQLKKGEIITAKKISEIRKRLNSLGLFSIVRVTPFIAKIEKDRYLINLLIQVEERDFNFWELAPGYRSDIGLKLSLGINFGNVFGLNHDWLTKIQANQRLNYSNLDARRKDERRNMFEMQVSSIYTWPYVFWNHTDLDILTSFRRKRFFSFDAQIINFSPKLNHAFNKNISAGLRYQFETIHQFDASHLKDSGRYQIGSLTPSIILDYRDHVISPRSGSFFSLFWEFANPTLFSNEDNTIVVDFYKIVSRNKFYYPLSESFVLATSLAVGFEKNLANETKLDTNGAIEYDESGNIKTRGFIPSIKVFRLNGIDKVRGFGDSEINRLDSGLDIGEVRIQDSAFFANFKFEPRYYANDNIALSVFFDAGKVFINHFKPLVLRTAIGTSFKFLTPVGTMDLDFGVKLRPHKLLDGGREKYGRIHFSIGHF